MTGIGSVHVTGPIRVSLPVRRLDPDLPLPSYAHPGDAGADLCSATDVVLEPGEVAEFDTRLPHWFGGADERRVEFLSIFGREGERMHTRARSTTSRASSDAQANE